MVVVDHVLLLILISLELARINTNNNLVGQLYVVRDDAEIMSPRFGDDLTSNVSHQPQEEEEAPLFTNAS